MTTCRNNPSVGQILACCVLTTLLISEVAMGKRRRARRYLGPPLTHPVVLWSRTLAESPDPEGRRIAAFKLSQYSQKIFQAEAVRALIDCTKDEDFELEVLCTKALGNAGNQSQAETIRSALLELFDTKPRLRSTVVRAFVARRDISAAVSEKLLGFVQETKDTDSILSALNYFETLGLPSTKLVSTMSGIFNKSENGKIRRAVTKVLAEQGGGQPQAIEILSQCGGFKDDTPLILICLAGLQQQAKTDSRTWGTVEKALESNDPDVQLAVVDLIIALPASPNAKISERLLSMMEDIDDDDLLEKVVLSLGVVGDGSSRISEALQKTLENKEITEGIRIAAALTIAKQSSESQKTRGSLSKCLSEEKSETLRSACQLGVVELDQKPRSLTSPKTGSM